MGRPQRSSISDILKAVQPASAVDPVGEHLETETAVSEPPRGTKARTRQQTLYLHPAVWAQLRELAFAEEKKMHAIVLEGLDRVFRDRGMRSVAELTRP